MDSSDPKYKHLYKLRGTPNLKKKGKQMQHDKRKTDRHMLLMKKREIVVTTTAKEKAELLKEKLKTWKEEKKREAAARKAKEKKIFKVHHLSVSSGMPDLEHIYNCIKGKPISRPKKPAVEKTSKKKLKRQDGFDCGYQISKAGPSNGIRAQLGEVNLPSLGGGMKRSSKHAFKSADVIEVVYRSPEERPRVQSEIGVNNLQMLNCATPPYPTTPTQEDLTECNKSPHVTISRVKASSSKEFHKWISQEGFYKVLDSEITRIGNMCTDWLEYKDNQNPPEKAKDMINMAVGQSKLLINKKFKQFRSLIKHCVTSNTDRPVTCLDLLGYWEAAYLEVEDLNKRFENLANLRRDNWIEILPQIDIPQKKKKKVIQKPNEPKAQSVLKDLIKAQRQIMKDQTATLVKSPSPPKKFSFYITVCYTTYTSRKSLLPSVVLNETRTSNSCTSFAMINAAKIGRHSSEAALAVDDGCTSNRTTTKTQCSKSILQKSSPDLPPDVSSIGNRRFIVTHTIEPGSAPGNVFRESRQVFSSELTILIMRKIPSKSKYE